jgi:hypothetical protein
MPIARLAVILTAMATALGACGVNQGAERAARSEAPADEAPSDDVALGEAFAQLRGHQRAALEAYRAGDKKTAVIHAFHPVHEIMAGVRSAIDPGLARRLAAAVEAGTEAVTSNAPAGRVRAAFARAASLTDAALKSVVGHEARADEYRASVVASLVQTAAHEFEEAAPKGRLESATEYQDGYAFVREAQSLFDDFGAGPQAAAVARAFDRLLHLLPSLQPPERLPSPDEVEESAESVVRGLERSFNAHPPEKGAPDEVADTIEDLLDEIAAAYAAGDSARASELAAEAYLENYEDIEAEVIEEAPDINAQLEPLLGAELRRRIESGATVEEINSLIEEANRLLDRALEALESQ